MSGLCVPLGSYRHPTRTQIKHFVVLLLENRPIDHTFGCMAGEGVIGLDGIKGTHDIPKDPDDPTGEKETVTCGTANYVCKQGPPMSMWDLHYAPSANHSVYPYVPPRRRTNNHLPCRRYLLSPTSLTRVPGLRAQLRQEGRRVLVR